MAVDTETAAATAVYQGQRYYFCAEQCAAMFRSDPDQYVGGDTDADVERHEPPFTKEGITAPKFGAAGSGGAEYERPPERHDRP